MNKGFENLIEDIINDDKQLEYLNKVFSTRFKARLFTLNEYIYYRDYRAVRTLKITDKQIEFITQLHNSIFSIKKSKDYTIQDVMEMINKLDVIFESYKI